MKLLPLLALAFSLCVWCEEAQAAPPPPADLKWDHMDLGRFQAGTFKVKDQITAKGIAIRVGEGEKMGTVLFDPELLRWSAAWTGGFILFPRVRGGLEGQIAPDGDVVLSTDYAPGWVTNGTPDTDPRPNHQGSLPHEAAKWDGFWRCGKEEVLSYRVSGMEVIEKPGFEMIGDKPVFIRDIEILSADKPSTILLCDLPGGEGSAEGNLLVLKEPGKTDPAETSAIMIGASLRFAPPGVKLRVGANGRAVLDVPAKPGLACIVRLRMWSGKLNEAPKSADLQKQEEFPFLDKMADGMGPPQWGEPIETKGELSTATDQAYVADEITFPEDNPFGSWFRPGGHDFLPDGRAVVASLSGDVWIVSGLDDSLQHVKWKRFATGLFQPLGVRIVDGGIYVLGRDQITLLRDFDGDGEADWYHCFNNDCIVTANYHEFALDLQTDSAGNFYFAKGSPWQPTVTSPHQGCLFKVSPDGAKMEIIATGLRAPNGMAIGPNDEISISDNQGHWMPSNRLNIIKPGGFYGMVSAAHRKLTFDTAEGRFQADPSSPEDQAAHKEVFWGNPKTPTPEEGYDLPLCWLPMPIDNSSGGEVWVPPGERWGPLGGEMLQMSYGKCALFLMLREVVEGVPQAAMVRFPIKFPSGIMRGRFNPHDGQLYLTGLRVWQTDAVKDGCFTRVRYTGKPVALPVAQRTTSEGLEITYSAPLAPEGAYPDNFDVTEWNYLWSGAYGSPDFSVHEPKKQGRDSLEITAAKLSADRKTIALKIPDLLPAMQTRVKYKLPTADGLTLDQETYGTLHRLPGGTRAAVTPPATRAPASAHP